MIEHGTYQGKSEIEGTCTKSTKQCAKTSGLFGNSFIEPCNQLAEDYNQAVGSNEPSLPIECFRNHFCALFIAPIPSFFQTIDPLPGYRCQRQEKSDTKRRVG